MKRIAFFHPVDDHYGASNILAYIISFLHKDYICDVYVPKITGVMRITISELELDNVNFIELDFLPLAHRKMFNIKGLGCWVFQNIKLLKVLFENRKKYDLIYINTLSLFSISVLCRILVIKNLVHCHEFLAESFFGKMMKFAVGLGADSVISVSNHVHSYISDGSSKYKVIHNGIPDVSLPDSDRSQGQTSIIDIAFVARIMPEKGHWFLVEALEHINDNVLNKIKINIYGDAPPLRPELYEELRGIINEKGLSEIFCFHGFCANVSKKISQSDLCLIPSMMADPFPTTVIEALRAGKVCIVTDHGGAAEIIDNKSNGFLIPPDNAEQFSNLLTDIVLKKYDLAKIGINARLTFEKGLTLDHFKEKMSAHLVKLI